MIAKHLFSVVVLTAGLVLSSSTIAWNDAGGERDRAMTLKPDWENGLDVYEVCSACHLAEGWGTKNGDVPQLAGQHRTVLIKQLADIRALNRDNPDMYLFTLPETIGDEQGLADVTAYIAKLPMNPDNGKGEWGESTPEFAQGQTLFRDNCIKCHGEKGEGNGEMFFPKLQGQHYEYMLRQLEWIRNGKRRNANPGMAERIQQFSSVDMRMVINYVSQIPVPKEDLAPSVDWKNPDFD
ncbi:MAG: c-type cytochrome [Gammaproteobacteria bacterium]|nr:c-type cytochrome [Gammaproteobacteria bacterium]